MPTVPPVPAADLLPVWRRLAAGVCDGLVRPPDWSPSRDVEWCGRCRRSVGDHAAQVLVGLVDAGTRERPVEAIT